MIDINYIIENRSLLLKKGDDNYAAQIEKMKQSGKDIVIFGAGDAGRLAQESLLQQGMEIKFFIDNSPSKWNSIINRKKVLNPDSLRHYSNLLVIICCWDSEGIYRQLFKLGIKDIEQNFYTAIMARKDREFFSQHLKEVSELEQLLSDKKSRRLLLLLLHSLTLDNHILNSIHEGNQYFFDKEFDIKDDETIIDAGAFTGDTVEEIINRFGTIFKTIHCFEPNENNFQKLLNFIAKRKLGAKVITHKLALSDKRSTLNFSGSGSGYHLNSINETSEEGVEAVTIDELFKDQPVSFIKMDIEGAEVMALRGGRSVIQRDKPRLAICVYHFPEHLWEIPKLVKSFVPEYRLFLRHHTNQRRETVLYAIV